MPRANSLRLNPHFKTAIRACPLPGWQLARRAGFRHHSRFSNLLHAGAVPATAAPLFQAIAGIVGFPPDQIFVGEFIAEPPRLVKRDEAAR